MYNLFADHHNTKVVSMADDTAISVDITNNNAMIIGFGTNYTSYFMVMIRTSGTPGVQSIQVGTDINNAGNATLSGTTSTDGKLNIAASTGKFYVENRLGNTQNVKFLVIGG